VSVVGRGRSSRPRVSAVKAWPVFWALCVCCEVWPAVWTPCGRRGSVAGFLGLVCSPWGVIILLGLVRPPWGRRRFSGPRMLAVVAWPIPWSLYVRHVGVVGPLGFACLSRGRGRSDGPLMSVVGHGMFPGPRISAVRVWPVLWAPYVCRVGVAGPLGPVCPLRVRCWSPGPRMFAVGALPVT